MTTPEARASGLKHFRQRKAEEKAARMAELAEYRKSATVVERDGREYVLVRIPDRYGWAERDRS